MPAISSAILVDSIFDAVQQSGGNCVYTSTSTRTHPRKFLISQSNDAFSLWVYIWTLTHGGRKSLPNEYRIQMTSVKSPLTLNPNGPTVLLGYYHDFGVFAGFDIKKRQKFTAGSPSVQISIDTINDALQQGLAFSVKENNEIAAGIRPDQILNYIRSSEQIHQYGNQKPTQNFLIRASQNHPISEIELQSLSKERKKIISKVIRYSRDGNFRQQVLSAYNNRCAVTRAQLQLVDAAHILPVEASESIDHVSNGISLSPTIHRAFDNRLIYLDEKYFMRSNDEKIKELKKLNLHSGQKQLYSLLNKKIHLPADSNQWPSPKFIKKANRHRRIPGFC